MLQHLIIIIINFWENSQISVHNIAFIWLPLLNNPFITVQRFLSLTSIQPQTYTAPSNRMKTCHEDLKNRLYDLRLDGESASTHDCSFSCNSAENRCFWFCWTILILEKVAWVLWEEKAFKPIQEQFPYFRFVSYQL